MNEKLYRIFSEKSDEELLRILNHPGDYTEEALIIARLVAEERGGAEKLREATQKARTEAAAYGALMREMSGRIWQGLKEGRSKEEIRSIIDKEGHPQEFFEKLYERAVSGIEEDRYSQSLSWTYFKRSLPGAFIAVLFSSLCMAGVLFTLDIQKQMKLPLIVLFACIGISWFIIWKFAKSAPSNFTVLVMTIIACTVGAAIPVLAWFFWAMNPGK